MRRACGFSAAILWIVAACGCGRSGMLEPARSARVVPGKSKTAVAEAAGVRVMVDGEAWAGDPKNLAEIMHPLRLTIENHSGRPVRIRLDDFALVESSGFQSTPLPPLRVGFRAPAANAITPEFEHSGFFVVPDYKGYYGEALPFWSGPFDYTAQYNRTYYASWLVPLPTPDMQKKAIPEGVLASGGRLSGFLYFHKITAESPNVLFTYDLVDGNTQQSFGKVEIPLMIG